MFKKKLKTEDIIYKESEFFGITIILTLSEKLSELEAELNLVQDLLPLISDKQLLKDAYNYKKSKVQSELTFEEYLIIKKSRDEKLPSE